MENENEKKKTVSEREEETLKYWKDHTIFEKSLAARKDNERFIFY